MPAGVREPAANTQVTQCLIGGKAIVLTAGATGPATATVAGAASTALHATAKFDTTQLYSAARTISVKAP